MGDSSGEKCPVDHTTRSTWTNLTSGKAPTPSACSPASPSSTSDPFPTSTIIPPPTLSTSRDTSSIPRTTSSNWVYPSEAQFFAAMARKNHDPRASDMRVIVPIHNAVNERAWAAVRAWEDGRGGERCGGVRLVSFKGRPGKRSPKAWAKVILGYTAPFDRHDWVVDRCGVRMRYIIDFYTGRTDPSAPQNPSFYIDARPALDSWEGVKMRAERFWEQWVGRPWGSSIQTTSPVETNKDDSSGGGLK